MRIVGANLLKRLGVTFVAVMLGLALVQKILAQTPGAVSLLAAAVLLASPAAYLIREACKTKARHRPAGRARERTRVPIADFEED